MKIIYLALLNLAYCKVTDKHNTDTDTSTISSAYTLTGNTLFSSWNSTYEIPFDLREFLSAIIFTSFTCPTFWKNSSSSFGLTLADSCIHITVLLSQSSEGGLGSGEGGPLRPLLAKDMSVEGVWAVLRPLKAKYMQCWNQLLYNVGSHLATGTQYTDLDQLIR